MSEQKYANKQERKRASRQRKKARDKLVKQLNGVSDLNAIVGYADRPAVLLSIGFKSYRAYLDSDLWKALRKRVLVRCNYKCRLCSALTGTVHHVSYDKATLLGVSEKFLVPLCNGCHQRVEFDSNGNKLSVAAAKKKLKSLRGKKRSRPEIGLAHREKHLRRKYGY